MAHLGWVVQDFLHLQSFLASGEHGAVGRVEERRLPPERIHCCIDPS